MIFSSSAPIGGRSDGRGFTLVELLVVIGVIALLLGVIGMGLGGGNQTTSLQSAQGTLTSLLSSVRAQAALTGRDAALLVNVNPANPERYLRYCVVAVRSESDASVWVPANEGYYLPVGVYVLPRTSPTGDSVQANVAFRGLASSAFDDEKTAIIHSTVSEMWMFLGVTPLGQRANVTTTPNGEGRSGNLVLTVGAPQPPGSSQPVKFTNADNVRGLFISKYGVASFINERSGF